MNTKLYFGFTVGQCLHSSRYKLTLPFKLT